MPLENLQNLIPDYAKDIRLNLSSLAGEEILNTQQRWGTFLASALAARNPSVIQEVAAEAGRHLSPEAQTAARAAAAIMAMNNVYYKFTGMMEDEYRTLPAKLRMNVLANPGADKTDFELWSLAVSAINGCQYCIKSHEKKVRAGGLSLEQVQAAVRIASVVHAAAAILDGEEALAGEVAAAA